MSLSQSLQQRQSQSLVMTPRLAQSIKLLQLGHHDLSKFISEEIEKNPLLEIDNNAASSQSDTGLVEADTQEKTSNIEQLSDSSERPLDTSYENVYDGGTAGAEMTGRAQAPSSTTTASSEDNFDFIANLGSSTTLAQHLEHQIGVEFARQETRDIALFIAHGLDEDGYFREDLDGVAAALNTSIEMIHWVLERFQTLEPVGVGARSLSECLEIQLREKNRFDPAMQTLVTNIDMLAKRQFSQLIKLCGVEREDFVDMIGEIKALDPRPAAAFISSLAETVEPDVFVTADAMGAWKIELNNDLLPRVLVDRDYYTKLTRSVGGEEERRFVDTCLESANWLTKALDQRAQTILKVATEIVRQQDRFFAEGVGYLKPMTLKEVAEKIDVHESTVSRVTNNKYLTCDQGMFELKFFFSSAVTSSDGETAISAEAVKHHIQKLIDEEAADQVLSDDDIAAKLQETGISIARRTVAKYREALRISSSVQRRRQKTSAF